MTCRELRFARFLLGAALLAWFLTDSGAARPVGGEARAGREVFRALAGVGQARVIVTLRRAEPELLERKGPASRVDALLDEVLAGVSRREVREEARLRSIPVLMARISSGGLYRLLADSRVSRIDLDGEIRGVADDSVSQIGADRVQALGFVGQGVIIAVLDSGTDPIFSPDLNPGLVGEECFCSNGGGCCPNGSSRQSGPGSAASIASHGPAVLGILTADGIEVPKGVAPSAGVVAIRVLDDRLIGTFFDILAALDWIVENRPDVRLVNLSIAAGLFPAACDHESAFNEAMAGLSELFRSRGGLLFAASGNNGSASAMGTPACVTSVVSVGAVGPTDQFLSFTNASGALDLVAPGLGIRTTGSFRQTIFFTGTSAATPHATGTAALMLSADPSLSAEELEERLEESGLPVVDTRTGVSYPRVDALKAVAVPVEVALTPSAFARHSRGRGLLARVEPSAPFAAADLDPASLTLSLPGGPLVHADDFPLDLGDADGDGVPDLTVSFDRRRLLLGGPGPGTVRVVLKGAFLSGLGCRGEASLRLLSAREGNPSDPTP